MPLLRLSLPEIFFCDVRAGESFLFVFVDSLRFQRSTRLRAGFV
jgi:hypothetical protein